MKVLMHCNRWSLGMDKQFHPTLRCACDYISMLGWKLNHVNEGAPAIHPNKYVYFSRALRFVLVWYRTIFPIFFSITFDTSHYCDVIMGATASQITSLMIVYSTFIQAQIKENIIAPRHWPLRGIHRWPVNSPAQRASNAENVSIWWSHHGQ